MANNPNNSTWMDATNVTLEMTGQLQITSAAEFNDPVNSLTRIQSQARRFIDVSDRLLNLKLYNRDNIQEYQLLTHTGNPDIQSTYTYALTAGTRMEFIRYGSFYNATPQNVTLSGETTIFAQPLNNMPYREFRQTYPDFTAITTGPPQWWIIMPKSLAPAADGTAGVGITVDQIMFYPIPDQQYTIIYEAAVVATPLVNATDPILFSPDNEHVLWNWGKAFLEDALGEGKGQSAQYYAEMCLRDYNWRMSGPEEERRAIRTGMYIWGPLKGRRVSPYSDTPNASTGGSGM